MSTKIRHAVRAVIVNSDNKVLLIHATNKNYHQLPGGGVNMHKESIEDAEKREVLEETGYKVKLLKNLGVYEERDNDFINKSYGFLTQVTSKNEKCLQQDEGDFNNVWFNFEKALTVMRNSLQTTENTKYKSFFQRELEFLKRAKKELV